MRSDKLAYGKEKIGNVAFDNFETFTNTAVLYAFVINKI